MNTNETRFDAHLTAALERQPEIAVPADFAARLAVSLPAARPVRVTHYGRTAAYLCMAILTAALFLLPILRPDSLQTIRSGASLLEIAFTLELMFLFFYSDIWQTY
jgi:hypothetical protein